MNLSAALNLLFINLLFINLSNYALIAIFRCCVIVLACIINVLLITNLLMHADHWENLVYFCEQILCIIIVLSLTY